MIEYHGLKYEDDCAGQLLADREPPTAPTCPVCAGEMLMDDYGGWWCVDKCKQTQQVPFRGD